MNEGSIARRYARALLELGSEQGVLERVGSELEDFVSTLEAQDVLREVLLNPAFSKDDRRRVLGAVLERSGYAEVTRNFLMLLVDKSRIDQYRSIAREYARGVDEALSRMRATVRSAVPLDAAALERLRRHLEAVTGRQVILEAQVDPSLIGGVVTQVGSRVFDGSIRTQLEALRTRLLKSQLATA